MSATTEMTLITIVGEGLIERRLMEELRLVGVTGYTLTRVDGEGSRGTRVSDWEGGNVRVECLATAEVAGKVIAMLEAHYFPHFAVVAWLQEVKVVRGEKYAGPPREENWRR